MYLCSSTSLKLERPHERAPLVILFPSVSAPPPRRIPRTFHHLQSIPFHNNQTDSIPMCGDKIPPPPPRLERAYSRLVGFVMNNFVISSHLITHTPHTSRHRRSIITLTSYPNPTSLNVRSISKNTPHQLTLPIRNNPDNPTSPTSTLPTHHPQQQLLPLLLRNNGQRRRPQPQVGSRVRRGPGREQGKQQPDGRGLFRNMVWTMQGHCAADCQVRPLNPQLPI